MLQHGEKLMHVSQSFIFWWVGIVNNHLYAGQEHHFTDQVKGMCLSVIQSSKGVTLSMWKTLNISEKSLYVEHFHLVLLSREMLNAFFPTIFFHFCLLSLLIQNSFIWSDSRHSVCLFFVNCMLCHADLVWASHLCCWL